MDEFLMFPPGGVRLHSSACRANAGRVPVNGEALREVPASRRDRGKAFAPDDAAIAVTGEAGNAFAYAQTASGIVAGHDSDRRGGGAAVVESVGRGGSRPVVRKFRSRGLRNGGAVREGSNNVMFDHAAPGRAFRESIGETTHV